MATRTVCALLFALGTTLAHAQNLLPNPDFNTGTFPWELPPNVLVGGWTSIDGAGCAGSGSFEAPFICDTTNRAEILNDECIAITPAAGNNVYVQAEFSSVPNLSVNIGMGLYLFANDDCTDPVDAFPAYTNPTFEALTSAGKRFAWTFNFGILTVHSVRVASVYAQLDLDPCTTQVARFDSIYLGVAPLIFDHNFENGGSCPFQTPG